MKKILLLVAATCLCFMVNSGFALTINDSGVVGTIEAGTQSSDVPNEIEWANYLLGMVGTNVKKTADGNTPLDGATENYETGDYDYKATLTGGVQTDDLSGYDWVLGKYDGKNAGYVLFYMPDFGDTIPQLSYSIWGDEGQYQLSHTTAWKGGDTPVPEPATMLLFGIGLLGLAGVSRKR